MLLARSNCRVFAPPSPGLKPAVAKIAYATCLDDRWAAQARSSFAP